MVRISSIENDVEETLYRPESDKSDLSKIVEILLNSTWGRRKTRLRQRVVTKLTTIDTIAQIYNVEWLLNWVESYTEYVTSVDGKGRQEIVDITKFSIDKENQRNMDLINALGKR